MAGDRDAKAPHQEELAASKEKDSQEAEDQALATGGFPLRNSSGSHGETEGDKDARIAELERRLAKEAANKDAMTALSEKVEELEAQAEAQKIDYELKLAGCRSVKAGRALLDDHGGDIDALKAAEPWLFADAPAKQSGKTGLPNAGTASDNGKVMKRWRRLAGLDDLEDKE